MKNLSFWCLLALSGLSFLLNIRDLPEVLLLLAILMRIERRLDTIEQSANAKYPPTSNSVLETAALALQSEASKDSIAVEDADWNDWKSFEMTDSRLEASSGWDRASVNIKKKTYSRCFGGPPAFEDTWEYQLLGDSVVIQRLVNRSSDDLYIGKEYDVINGQLDRQYMEARNAERRDKPGLLRFIPYDAETISSLTQQSTWHELHGAIKYFILANEASHISARELKRLTESFEKLASDAGSLGAVLDEYGNYQLPEGADETSQQKLREIFSSYSLRTKYRLRSLQDWYQREHILKLANRTANSS